MILERAYAVGEEATRLFPVVKSGNGNGNENESGEKATSSNGDAWSVLEFVARFQTRVS